MNQAMRGNTTFLNLLKKYWEKLINYWLRKVNIDTTNWEKIFGKSTDLLMQHTMTR